MSKRVEKFLREIGLEPAESTSRNPLESPWLIGEEDFLRRTRNLTGLSEALPKQRGGSGDLSGLWQDAREETMSTTEEIVRVEKEIDERVKNLYGI